MTASCPIIMAVAKGLAGGYLPLGGGHLLHERLRGADGQRHGGLLTGHTFTGHTTACAAGRRGADHRRAATGCWTRCARTGSTA